MDAKSMTHMPPTLSPLDQPTVRANETAVRIQRAIAFAVVVVPLFGCLAAIVLGWKQGVTRAEIGILIGAYIIGMLGITLGFHRHFAHRSFKTSRAMQVVFAILGSMAAQGPLFFWVATHRRHHAYSDVPGDPHSPQLSGQSGWAKLKGFWHGHIGWMFSEEQTNWGKFVPDLIKDKLMYRMHRLYLLWVLLGLAIPAAAGGLLIGTGEGALAGFLWGGLVRICLVNQALWCVGSICHMFGRRVFQQTTWDQSADNYWVALVTFGEGNQNSHHAFPSSARHGLAWWQPDFTADVIGALTLSGLIWDVTIPHASAIQNALNKG